MTRACIQCGQVLPMSEFRTGGRKLNDRCSVCREAVQPKRREPPRPRTGRAREHQQWRAARMEKQDGQCAICGASDKPLVVDHDHNHCPAGRSCHRCRRGLLCNGCNSMLGHAADDPERLEAGAEYLMRWAAHLRWLQKAEARDRRPSMSSRPALQQPPEGIDGGAS